MHNLIIVSGPSGSGKSTLIRKLLAVCPELRFSVSHTTRPARENEVNGRDYHFVSRRVFQKMRLRREFAEWAEVHGQLYGTSWRELRGKSNRNRTLVLDIDVQGARSIKRRFSQAMAIFVVPPSLAELKRRLRQREKKWSPETEHRLQKALNEIRGYKLYDYLIVNQDLKKAFAELRCLQVAFGRQMARNEEQIKKLLRGRK
ncbi:MAG: guanylate kinase [Candidatus Aminicenantes bacterium]|nr:guanylate kinase [Candidatus Aminicenantes bacterium]